MGLFRGNAPTHFKEPATPFGGWDDEDMQAITGPHVLVSGPSGVGKSRRVLGPGIILWDGPVVAVSSKPDLVDLCVMPRLRDGGYGKTYILDLSGEVPDDVVPDGVEKVYIDPTVLIRSDDDALDMATVLIESGSAGAGGKDSSGDGFWNTLSTGPLAAILRATGDLGINWARTCVGAVDRSDDIDDDDAFANQPCWEVALERLEAMESSLVSQLSNTRQLDGKMRDSVTVTMTTAVAPWQRSTVAGRPGEKPFSPSLIEDRAATLFMIAPATGVAAGAAVAAVDFISKRWRANQTEKQQLPRVLMAVDELCNTLPWQKLPTVVTESRAMGINLLVAVQSTAQFARRYGREGMEELREIFPCTLLLTGAPEKDMIEKAAWWAGKHEVTTQSVDRGGHLSTSAELRSVIEPDQLIPKDIDHGRLLRGRARRDEGKRYTEAGIMVTLRDIAAIPGLL